MDKRYKIRIIFNGKDFLDYWLCDENSEWKDLCGWYDVKEKKYKIKKEFKEKLNLS